MTCVLIKNHGFLLSWNDQGNMTQWGQETTQGANMVGPRFRPILPCCLQSQSRRKDTVARKQTDRRRSPRSPVPA